MDKIAWQVLAIEHTTNNVAKAVEDIEDIIIYLEDIVKYMNTALNSVKMGVSRLKDDYSEMFGEEVDWEELDMRYFGGDVQTGDVLDKIREVEDMIKRDDGDTGK